MTLGHTSFSRKKKSKGKKESKESNLEHLFITGEHGLTAIHTDSLSQTEDMMCILSVHTVILELSFSHIVKTRFPILSLTKNA